MEAECCGGTERLNAILIGGTGATGRCLLGSLLQAKDKVSKVTVIGRSKVYGVADRYGVDVVKEEKQRRLRQHVQDLDEVNDEVMKVLCAKGHVFFNCMGARRACTSTKQNFIHIDYEIPFRLIKLAKAAGVKHCSLLSSLGAKADSSFLYLKTKGLLEDSITDQRYEHISIFRPGLLDRGVPMSFGAKVSSLFFSPMKVSDVAEAMFQDAWTYHCEDESIYSSTTPIYDNDGIYRLCKEAAKEVKR